MGSPQLGPATNNHDLISIYISPITTKLQEKGVMSLTYFAVDYGFVTTTSQVVAFMALSPLL